MGRRTKRAEEYDDKLHSMASEYLYRAFPRLQDENTKLELAVKIVNKFGTSKQHTKVDNTAVLDKAEELAKQLLGHKNNRIKHIKHEVIG